MKKILISLLVLLLAAPVSAQVDKDHDFKVAKNMDIFNSIYKNMMFLICDCKSTNFS